MCRKIIWFIGIASLKKEVRRIDKNKTWISFHIHILHSLCIPCHVCYLSFQNAFNYRIGENFYWIEQKMTEKFSDYELRNNYCIYRIDLWLKTGMLLHIQTNLLMCSCIYCQASIQNSLELFPFLFNFFWKALR